jgi:hypothetical protein
VKAVGGIALALALVAGCRSSMADRVRVRHATAFGCEERTVDVTQVDRRTFVAEGCDLRAVYTCSRSQCSIDGEPTSMWAE